MTRSLFQLNPLKMSKRRASSTALLLTLPILFTTFTPLPAQAQPKAASMLLGVVDEEKLAQSRSDFPLLAAGVLPQVAAKRHLTLVVSKQGLKWGQSKVPSVDVTGDVLALLRDTPAKDGAFTASQQAAAQKAFDALSALGVALRIGNLSYDAYVERLTNTTILFTPAMRQVPEGALKTRLSEAMQAFTDVRTNWDECTVLLKTRDRELDANQNLRRVLLPASERNSPELLQMGADEHAQARREVFRPLKGAQEKPLLLLEIIETMMPASSTK